MDAFEAVVAGLLTRRGYWVQTSVKVELTKQEKVEIGRASSPRWELDVVGYRGRDNELLVLDCKSFLDSVGVRLSEVAAPAPKSRYKLFTEPALRNVVLGRLRQQMVERGFCSDNPTIRLGMAAGRVKPGDSEALRQLFEQNGWVLLDPESVRSELRELADTGYENLVAAVVSKILLRK